MAVIRARWLPLPMGLPGTSVPPRLIQEQRRDLRRAFSVLVPPLTIFLHLEAALRAAVCEVAFFGGAIVIGEAFLGSV